MFGFGQQNTFKVAAFPTDYGYLNQMVQLDDGSFVGVGEFFYSDYEDTGYLIKTDSKGNVLASKTIQTTAAINSIVKTSDGGFAVCGSLYPRVQLIKFKADLSVQWEKDYTLDNGGDAEIFRMIQTTDGVFLMTGDESYNYSDHDSDGVAGYVMKADAVGNVQFSKRYFEYNENRLTDVVATTDGNYGLLGETDNSDETPDSTVLLKIKPDGDIIWSRTLFSNKSKQSINPYGLLASSGGGLVIAGYLYTPGNYAFQLSMAKYDNDGSLLWSENMLTASDTNTYADGVIEDKDGGYLFYGGLETYSDNVEDYTDLSYIVKTNAAGALQWTKTFSTGTPDDFEEFYNLIKTSDGGYAACGDGSNFDSTIDDYIEGGFIHKFDTSFQICDNISTSTGTIQNSGMSMVVNIPTADLPVTDSVVQTSLYNTATINNICSGSVLPLQFLSFNASLQNKRVAINWTTANEINTSHFIIERSKDASSFTALQQVTAKGNSSGVQSYSINDWQPLPGTSYYRLKEVDKDGKITYSSLASVTMLNNGTIVISPNPVRDVIKVIVQSESNASLACQVIDMKGTILASQKASVASGRNEIRIPAASLAKGVYVLKVIDKNSTQTIRFVKE